MKWDEEKKQKIHSEKKLAFGCYHFTLEQLQIIQVGVWGFLWQVCDTGPFLLLNAVVVVTIEQVELGTQPTLGETVFAHFRYNEMSGQRNEHYQCPVWEVLLSVFVEGEFDDSWKSQQLFTTKNSECGRDEERGDASIFVTSVCHVNDDQQLGEKQDEHQVRAE